MAFLIILIGSWFHPFHVSVSNIIYKADQKVLQVEQSIFLDDFEEALRDFSGNQKLDITEDDSEAINALVKKYLSQHFKVTVDDKSIQMAYLGNEIILDDNVMWCYYEAEKIKSFGSFKVMNDLLTEKFSDQENIIHYKTPSGTKSQRTGAAKKWAAFGK
jgi:Zn-dependent metalloprotease